LDEIQHAVKSFLLEELLYDAPADFGECTPLIRNRLLDSLGLMRVIAFLESTFDIQIDPAELIPKNFETLEAITELVRRKCDTLQPN
jgi:acyl carrier protein